MEFFQYYNQSQFLSFVPKIKQNLRDWQIVEVSLTGKTKHNAAYIAKKLKEYFGDRDGIIFICNSRDILVLVNMGDGTDIRKLSSGINDRMPKYSCSAEATDITAEGLLKFQLRLQDVEEARTESANNPLLAVRKERAEKIVMVADDDMFMRTLISKTFKGRAHVIEHDDTMDIVESYLDALPDILFLDIHMPGGSGIEILEELLGFDDTAYIVIMSSDSVKDNVLEAKKLGAKGFIAKPFTPEKLEACYQKCPTVISDKSMTKEGG